MDLFDRMPPDTSKLIRQGQDILRRLEALSAALGQKMSRALERRYQRDRRAVLERRTVCDRRRRPTLQLPGDRRRSHDRRGVPDRRQPFERRSDA